MTTEVIIETEGRNVRLAANTFGRLLWVARSHGWDPEKTLPDPSGSRWDTEITGPCMECYMEGWVSDSDARELGKALGHILNCADREMNRSSYLALLLLLRVTNHGSFFVHPAAEDPSCETGRKIALHG